MELIVVMLLIGIVGSFTVRLLSSTIETYETIGLRSTLVNDGRFFAARFYREVKPIPFSDSLLVADEQAVQWKLDNGTVYTYTITGAEITRQVNAGLPQTLVRNVDISNSRFAYYDSTNVELTSVPLNLTDRKKVRLIGATIRFVSGSQTHTTHQRIYLANMRRH